MKTLLSTTVLLLFLLAPAFSAEPPAQEAEAPKVNYTYNATVVRVVDGGSVLLNVDVGFGVWLHNQTFKLLGIDAPDISAPDKTEAMRWKTRTQDVLPVSTEVTIQSIKIKEKPGGYRAVIWKDGVNLNAEITKAALK